MRHRLQKHWAKQVEIIFDTYAKTKEWPEYPLLAARFDAQQLIAVGRVFAMEDFEPMAQGLAFIVVGKMMADHPLLKPTEDMIKTQSDRLIKNWELRKEIGRTEYEARVRELFDEAKWNDGNADLEIQRLNRDTLTWSYEEFYGIPTSIEEHGTRENCVYCGARSYPDSRVLLPSGYCDEICQKLDAKWSRTDGEEVAKGKRKKKSKKSKKAKAKTEGEETQLAEDSGLVEEEVDQILRLLNIEEQTGGPFR
jgi:hypothetical protein